MGKPQQPIADKSHQETYEEPDEFDLVLIERANEILARNEERIPHNEVMKRLGPEYYEKYKI